MGSAGRRAALLFALAGGLAWAPTAAAQPWARFAVPDSSLPAALRAGAAGYEAAWNALLVAELRARLARADSASALLDLGGRIARAEPGALGSRIGLDALERRARWSRAQRRERVSAAVAESLGTTAENARQAGTADSLYRAALARYTALGEKRRRAWVLGSMGRNAFGAGDLAYADSVYRQALAARRELGDPRMVGATTNALGSTAWQRGQFMEARDFYLEARAIRERTGERGPLSQTLNFLGLAYRGLGEPDSARRAFGEALQIASALGDSLRTLDILVNLSDLLGRFGDLESVEAVERRALAITRERGLPDREALILLNTGLAYYRLGHFSDARARAERVLALPALTPEKRIDALNELGRVHLKLTDAAAARPPLERALALADSLDRPLMKSHVLTNLAIAAQLEGDASGAERLALRALDAANHSGDSSRVQGSLSTLGDLALERRDFAAAERAFARSAAISRSQGPQIHASELNNWAMSVLDRPADAERLYRLSLEASARANAPVERAFALLGLGELAERRGDFPAALRWAREGATLIDTTRSRQGAGRGSISLSSGWRFVFDGMIHLLVKLDARSPDSGWAAEAFHWAERARARSLLDLVAKDGGARPLTLAEARARVRDQDLALLEYAFGDSSTTLWVITGRGVNHFTLPGRAALGPRVEILRRGLADPERAVSKGTLAASRTLYRQLVEPALQALEGIERLIVSPDGPLALIPFEALLAAEPGADGVPARGDWLGSRWAVSYAFSASTLAARSGAGGGQGVVALADPEFGGALPPLPHTADEARQLERLAGARGAAFTGLSGAAATRAGLLALAALPGAALLHVATHGVANEIEPERSGLWLSPDSAGAPGFLSVADVAELRLSADLVTLSACETGLGRLERGEGVVGLTRAFVAAGARSVVVSLWRVNDRSSARLMERFYRELLARGRTRDRALAEARRALLRSPETRSPFYWAAFVLVGETGPIALQKSRMRSRT